MQQQKVQSNNKQQVSSYKVGRVVATAQVPSSGSSKVLCFFALARRRDPELMEKKTYRLNLVTSMYVFRVKYWRNCLIFIQSFSTDYSTPCPVSSCLVFISISARGPGQCSKIGRDILIHNWWIFSYLTRRSWNNMVKSTQGWFIEVPSINDIEILVTRGSSEGRVRRNQINFDSTHFK
jgi:hypothetical protein